MKYNIIKNNVKIPIHRSFGARNIAKEKGLKRYFTGKPCSKGHIAERYVQSKKCVECLKIPILTKEHHARVKKRYWLKNFYGLSEEQYYNLIKEQNYNCALCENKLELYKNTHVDHCHDTGKIRGILCKHCNVGIGHLRHNPKLLRKAALYCEQL